MNFQVGPLALVPVCAAPLKQEPLPVRIQDGSDCYLAVGDIGAQHALVAQSAVVLNHLDGLGVLEVLPQREDRRQLMKQALGGHAVHALDGAQKAALRQSSDNAITRAKVNR